MELDRYTRAVLSIIKRRYAEWDAAPPQASDIQRPQAPGSVKTFETVHGIQVPVHDEDWPTRTMAEKAFHALFRSPIYGLVDRDTPWPNPDAAPAAITEAFGPRLIPEENGHWEELQSDAAQRHFAFAGLASILLERTEHGHQVDVTWMRDLEVRPGFERYGACAHFAPDRTLTHIDWCHGDRTVRPGDPDWDHAKFAWRSSVFVGLTLREHLYGLHLRIGNDVVRGMREALPAEHPVRLLLKPFTFRTIAINHRAAAVLVVPRGLPHRAFGLTHDGLAQGLAAKPIPLRPFPQQLETAGTRHLDDFPYAEDGLLLWEAIETYVAATLALHWPTADHLAADQHLQQLGRAIDHLIPDESWAQGTAHERWTQALSSFIFSVVATHKHVGALREYLLHPGFVSGRIRPGSNANDQQGSALTMLLVAGTGLAQPMLLSDFGHLLPDDHTAEAATILERFQSQLRTVASTIEERNRTRVQPYHSMNPSRLECSVSI